MCAASAQSNQSFELMKDTIKSIVDKYGTSKIHYNVVIYGTLALPTTEFSDKTLTKEDVKEYIDTLPKPKGNVFGKLGNFAQTILSHGREPEIQLFPFYSVFTPSRL